MPCQGKATPPEAPLSSSCRGPTARGRVSRQEFMNFMAAEFDRDENKDGEPRSASWSRAAEQGPAGSSSGVAHAGFFGVLGLNSQSCSAVPPRLPRGLQISSHISVLRLEPPG
jgi:hypothetical protein